MRLEQTTLPIILSGFNFPEIQSIIQIVDIARVNQLIIGFHIVLQFSEQDPSSRSDEEHTQAVTDEIIGSAAMASVSSLDKDMRNIRLSKYTPQAANEVRKWIEDTLGERLAAGDLLEALKDGTALCKYAGCLCRYMFAMLC